MNRNVISVRGGKVHKGADCTPSKFNPRATIPPHPPCMSRGGTRWVETDLPVTCEKCGA